MKNFLDFCNEYRLQITLGLATWLFLLSNFWSPAIYIAAVIILISYAFSSIDEIFSYSFFFMLFSGVIVFYVVLAVGTFVIVFIKYIIEALQKKVKVYKLPLIATTIFSVIYAIIHYNVNSYGFFQGLLIIGLLYICYVIFCYRDKLSVGNMFKSMFAGIIVSLILSVMLYNIPNAKIFIFDNWNYGFTSAHDYIFLIAGKYRRLTMFSYHPNHLAAFCMFLLSYSLYVCMNYKLKRKIDIALYASMIITATIVGFLTLSKAFFIIFVLELIYVLVYLVIHLKKKSILYIMGAVLILIVFAAIFWKQIADIIERLLPNNASSNLNDITTGRVDIWKKFFAEIFSSPAKLIFGEGLFTTDVVDIGPHSIYIAILFRFGLVGILGLVAVIMCYFKEMGNDFNFTLIDIFNRALPLVVFLAYSVQEANIDERFFFLVTAVMLLFGNLSGMEPNVWVKHDKSEQKSCDCANCEANCMGKSPDKSNE